MQYPELILHACLILDYFWSNRREAQLYSPRESRPKPHAFEVAWRRALNRTALGHPLGIVECPTSAALVLISKIRRRCFQNVPCGLAAQTAVLTWIKISTLVRSIQDCPTSCKLRALLWLPFSSMLCVGLVDRCLEIVVSS